jgi:hypothetical protein
MEKETLIEEINLLWEPIRPYLAKQIEELYGRRDGRILEIGPFSGLIFSFVQKNIGGSFLIAAFPEEAVRSCRREARNLGLHDRVRIIESDSALTGVSSGSVDLAIFRGALFFPSLFQIDFGAIYRTLRTGGVAFVGGGFGKDTPAELISRIGRRSEKLNAAMGKVRVSVDCIRDQLASSNLEEKADIITDGGLWVVMKKG